MLKTTSMQHTPPRKWGVLVLFASIPTLLCCALPILFVSLGMGSVVALIYGEYLPFLSWFGQNKEITLTFTSLVLLTAAYLLFHPGRSCPTDPELAASCKHAQIINRRLFCISTALFFISLSSIYLLPRLL